MGANLAKTPLTAVLYAAMFTFVARFVSFSGTFTEAQAAYAMPVTGYIMLIVYGLWLSVIMALCVTHAKGRGVMLLLNEAVLFLSLGCILPVLEQILRGQPTLVMTTADTWMQVVISAVATLILLILGLLVMKAPEPDPRPVKYNIRVPHLIVKVIVSPLVFCILYFLTWYFLAWQVEAVRLYFTNNAGATDGGFIAEIINMLLRDAGMAGFSLIQGLLLVLCSFPLLFQLPGKRVMFLILNTMLYLCGALYWLIPGPVVPDAVRFAQLLRYGVLLLLYGVFTGFMLHTSLRAEVLPEPKESAAKPATGTKPTAGTKPAAAPGAKTSAPARR